MAEEDAGHHQQLRQDPIYLGCVITAKLFHTIFIKVPDFLLRQVPNSGSILSIGALYMFAQVCKIPLNVNACADSLQH